MIVIQFSSPPPERDLNLNPLFSPTLLFFTQDLKIWVKKYGPKPEHVSFNRNKKFFKLWRWHMYGWKCPFLWPRGSTKLSSIIIFQVGLKCLETLVFLDLKLTHAISVNGLAKPKFKVYSSRNQDHGNWKGRDESKIYNKQLTWVLFVTSRNIRPKVQPTRKIRISLHIIKNVKQLRFWYYLYILLCYDASKILAYLSITAQLIIIL